MKKRKKKKEYYHLCFKFGTNCKFCPRNKKCDEEIKREMMVHNENKSKI